MIFYTDGSASPNPGPGGFGVVIINKDKDVLSTYYHGDKQTTNNEQEMKAILYAVLFAAKVDKSALIYSDSSYAINTFSNWMYRWAENGWVKGDGKVPENLELVKAFYELSKDVDVTFVKVKGHSGDPLNELADQLAAKGRNLYV